MIDKEKALRIINLLYVVWFIISFAEFVVTRPLSILSESPQVSVANVLTTVYNFSALAICGVLVSTFVKKKEKLIPAVLGFVSGLSNLFTGVSIIYSGRTDYVALNPLVIGICTTLASAYVIVTTLREK
jgi:hypothetical protein